MADGDVQVAVRRAPRRQEAIAERMAAFDDTPPAETGVMPLNPGFFKMQRLRTASAAKARQK